MVGPKYAALMGLLRLSEESDEAARAAAAKAVGKEPGLLTRARATLTANLESLVKLLGCSREQAQKAVRGHPSLLYQAPGTLAAKLKSLVELLGCDKEQAQKLAMKQPPLLLSDPNTLAAKLAAMREWLPEGRSATAMVLGMPSLLCNNKKTLQDKFRRLEGCVEKGPERWRDELYKTLGDSACGNLLTYSAERIEGRLGRVVALPEGQREGMSLRSAIKLTDAGFEAAFARLRKRPVTSEPAPSEPAPQDGAIC